MTRSRPARFTMFSDTLLFTLGNSFTDCILDDFPRHESEYVTLVIYRIAKYLRETSSLSYKTIASVITAVIRNRDKRDF